MYFAAASSTVSASTQSNVDQLETRSRFKQLEELLFSQQKRIDSQQNEIELQRTEIHNLRQIIIESLCMEKCCSNPRSNEQQQTISNYTKSKRSSVNFVSLAVDNHMKMDDTQQMHDVVQINSTARNNSLNLGTTDSGQILTKKSETPILFGNLQTTKFSNNNNRCSLAIVDNKSLGKCTSNATMQDTTTTLATSTNVSPNLSYHITSSYMNPMVHPKSAIPPVANVVSSMMDVGSNYVSPTSSTPVSVSYSNEWSWKNSQPTTATGLALRRRCQPNRPASHHLIKSQFLTDTASDSEQQNNEPVIISHQHLDEHELDDSDGDGDISSACRTSHSRQRFVELTSSREQDQNPLIDLENIELVSSMSSDCSDKSESKDDQSKESRAIGRLARKEEVFARLRETQAKEMDMPYSYITFTKIEAHQLKRHRELQRRVRYRPKRAKLDVVSAMKQAAASKTAQTNANPEQLTHPPSPSTSCSTDLSPPPPLPGIDEQPALSPSLREILTKLPF